jgi:MYXO-CTERM domain-containing protein
MTMRRIAPMTALAVMTWGGAAHASNVVVLGDTPERTAVVEALTADGHNVIVADSIVGLTGVDVVWRLSPWGLAADEAEQLRYFVQAGHGLMLVGDAGDQGLADSYSQFVGTLTETDVVFQPSGSMDGVHRVNPDARGGIATAGSEPLTTWHPSGVGAIDGVSGENILTRDGEGVVSGAAWGDPDLPAYGGRIVAVMDRNWIDGGAESQAFIRNTTSFLSTVLQICGDGVRNGSEECDDGNAATDDDCTNQCRIAFCGDGVVNNGETCDNGMGTDDGECLSICEPARCGDGALWVGVENCDDGNNVDGDGCSAKCDGEAPAGVTGDVGEDSADGTSPERPAPDEPGNLGPVAGCSAGGSGGGFGGVALIGLALAFASRRRRAVR